jgi:hypothetical protein
MERRAKVKQYDKKKIQIQIQEGAVVKCYDGQIQRLRNAFR